MSATPAGPPTTPDAPRVADTDRASGDGAIDYAQIAATPEFQELHKSRARFAIGGTMVATAAMLLVFGLYGFAPDAMGKPAIGSVTWALVLGFVLIALTWVMAFLFARKSREWDAMAARVLEHVDEAPASAGRFAR
jgi:uncharacterized membrane protein (DUF485 family)